MAACKSTGAEAAHVVKVCAWCGGRGTADRCRALEGEGGLPHLITHGICATCFAEHAPGVPYPGA